MEPAKGKLKQGVLQFKMKKTVHFRPFPHNASPRQGNKIHEEEVRFCSENPVEKAPSWVVSTPEGSIPRRVRIKGGIVLPKKGVKVRNKKLQEIISARKKDDVHKVHDCEVQDRVPVSARAPNVNDPKLPLKYALLAEFFDCVVASIRLFKLRKQMCTFTNIRSRVELMTNRKFMHSHLAQIKHILDEAVVLEKVRTLDENSVCMKRDLIVTLMPNALQSGTEEQAGVISSADLRKIFRTKLLEFVNSHPEGEDIPEAPLPEPFNNNPQIESLSGSLEILGNSITATAATPSSVPSLKITSPLQRISRQREAQLSSIISSHLPRTFKRHFSQSPLPPELALLNAISEPVYPTGVTVLPSSLLDRLVEGNEQTTNKQIKKEDEEYMSKISCEKSHGLEDSKDSVSAKAPVKISSSVHESRDSMCDGTFPKTPSPDQVSRCSPSTPFYTCRAKRTHEDCEFPSTRSLGSTVFGSLAAISSFANRTSLVNSQPARQTFAKALQHGGALTLSEPRSSSCCSPITHVFYTPRTSVVDPSAVHRSNDLHDMKSVAFESSGKQPYYFPLVEKSPVFSYPVIRKAEQSGFDDLQYTQSLISLTPVVNGDIVDHLLVSVSPKGKKVSQQLPLMSPVMKFSSQMTQMESNHVKKEFKISKLQIAEHSGLDTQESAIAEEKMLESSINSWAQSLWSPNKNAVEVCKVELESVLKISQKVQQQAEEKGAKSGVLCKEGLGKMFCEIVKCPPARIAHLAWRSFSEFLLAFCSWRRRQ